MRTVRDESGEKVLLLKQSGESWLVRDPVTGEETYRPATNYETAEESPLAVAAAGVSEPVRQLLTAVRTERALGLLLEIDRSGPLAVRAMLERYEYCESDLQGQLAEFRAAELVETRQLGGERAYVTTTLGEDGLAIIRQDRD